MIVGVIVSLSAIVVVYGFLGSGIGTASASSTDMDRLAKLADTANEKCDAAHEEGPTIKNSVDVEFKSVQTVEIEKKPGKYVLVGTFRDKRREWDLNGCEYNLEVEGGGSKVSTSKSILWVFTVKVSEGENPGVTIVGTPQ